MRRITIFNIIAALMALSLAPLGYAGDPAGDFDLTWYTIDCGGGESIGGSFQLTGTIGQHDAGGLSGGEFMLVGGFWSGASDAAKPTCPGDLTGDGSVDVFDLLDLLGAWGPCPAQESCPADLTGDTNVDVFDLLDLLGAWGPCE